jgi:hypothetical protein
MKKITKKNLQVTWNKLERLVKIYKNYPTKLNRNKIEAQSWKYQKLCDMFYNQK